MIIFCFLVAAIKNSVKTPVVKPKRPKAFKPVSDELSTKLNRKITVYPSGEVVTQPLEKKDTHFDQNDSDNEIDKLSKDDDDGYMENKQAKKGKKKNTKKRVKKDENKEKIESNNEESAEYTKEELSYLQEMEDKKKNKKQKTGNKKTKTKQ